MKLSSGYAFTSSGPNACVEVPAGWTRLRLDDELRDGERKPAARAGIWLAIDLCPCARRRCRMIEDAGDFDDLPEREHSGVLASWIQIQPEPVRVGRHASDAGVDEQLTIAQ